MNDIRIAEELFAGLREISSDGEGVKRPSYSVVETRALEFLEHYALNHGLVVRYDGGGNAIFSLPEDADAEKFVLVGSHIDSVPNGGNYDGAAGIVAGIICLLKARHEGVRFERSVKVIALRGEESAWFGLCYIGSRALLGQLQPQELQAPHRETGRPLIEYLEQVGADVARIRAQQPLMDISGVEAYLELHIEQGPVLVELDKPLAVVSGIRGNFRHRAIHCIGEAGHSGAVPRQYRHDSVFAVASLLMRVDDHWKTILEHGGDLVVTTGIVSTNNNEHAMSRIPGDVEFSFEARSEHQDVLDAVHALLESEAKNIERERQVGFKLDPVVSSSAARMDLNIVEQLKQAAIRSDQEPYVMPSGAGHDAAVFANAGVPTGMIFVRNQNGSHNPCEAMEIGDFNKATGVLYSHLKGVAS